MIFNGRFVAWLLDPTGVVSQKTSARVLIRYHHTFLSYPVAFFQFMPWDRLTFNCLQRSNSLLKPIVASMSSTRQCIVLFYLAEIIGNKKQTLCHFVLGKESCTISIYYADWIPDQVRHDRENFPLSSHQLKPIYPHQQFRF